MYRVYDKYRPATGMHLRGQGIGLGDAKGLFLEFLVRAFQVYIRKKECKLDF